MTNTTPNGDWHLSDGTTVTEAMMQQWEDDLDDGNFHADLAHATTHRQYMKPPKGRPPILDESLVSLTFRAPESEVAEVRQMAKEE